VDSFTDRCTDLGHVTSLIPTVCGNVACGDVFSCECCAHCSRPLVVQCSRYPVRRARVSFPQRRSPRPAGAFPVACAPCPGLPLGRVAPHPQATSVYLTTRRMGSHARIFCTRPVLSVCPSPPARAIAGSASGHLSRASHPAPRPLNSALQHGVLTSARPSVSIALGPLMAVSCGTSISSLSSPTLTSAAVWHGGCIHMCAIHAPWDA